MGWQTKRRSNSQRATTAAVGTEARSKSAKSGFGMKLRKRLQNPFALVGQGFVAGGIIFFALNAESLLASPTAATPSDSLVTSLSSGR